MYSFCFYLSHNNYQPKTPRPNVWVPKAPWQFTQRPFAKPFGKRKLAEMMLESRRRWPQTCHKHGSMGFNAYSMLDSNWFVQFSCGRWDLKKLIEGFQAEEPIW